MNLKQLSGKSARRICDETQEIKKNKVNSLFKYVIDAGGLEGFDDIRWRYTAGVYGWNADVFVIDYLKVAVVSGYRPFGNVKAPNDLINEYNEKVKSVRGWEQKKELLREFAYAVLAAKGIHDSRRVKDAYPKGTIEALGGEDFPIRHITNEYGKQYPTESFDTDLEQELLDKYPWLDKLNVRDESGVDVPVFGDARTKENFLCLNENTGEFMNFLKLPYTDSRFEKYMNDYQDVIDFLESKGFVEVERFGKVSDSRRVSDSVDFITLFERLERAFGGCDANRNVAKVYVNNQTINVELSVDQVAYIYSNNAKTANDVADIQRSDFADDDSFFDAVIDEIKTYRVYYGR